MNGIQRRERRENRERLIKFILCSVLGLGAGALLGYPTTPTIAVSAILMLYIDRGYTGSIRYSWRRVRVQLVMGGIAMALIFLLRAATPLPDWAVGMVSAVIAITIGLPLQNRYQLAPLTVTLGNAALIMVTGILSRPSFYPERVLFCFLGAIIAHVVNFIVMPQADRYGTVCAQLREDAEALLGALLEGRAGAEPGVMKRSEAFLEKHIGFLKEDGRWKRRRLEGWRCELAAGLLDTEHRLIRTAEDLARWGGELDPDFRARWAERFAEGAALHSLLLDAATGEAPPVGCSAPELPCLPAEAPGEVVLAADLLHYLERLERLVKEIDDMQKCSGL